MPLKHSVYDTDTHFSINPVTRVLKNESMTKTGLIQFDHNSERFTFEIPRMIEGHDMSQCDIIQVHYNNIDAQTKEQSTGVYEVDDMQISPDGEDMIILSWLISGNATKFVGSLNFLIRFACTGDEGHVYYVWNTAIYSAISVSSGIYNGEVVVDEYADVLNAWKLELEATMEEAISGIDNAVKTEVAETIEDSPKFADSIAECIDTNKLYLLPDGYIYAHKSPVNYLTCGVDENGNIYEGKGYGVHKDTMTGLNDGYVSGWIPISEGDVVRFWDVTPNMNAPFIEVCSGLTTGTVYTGSQIGLYFNGMPSGSNPTFRFEMTSSDYNYFRIYLPTIDDTMTVTINEDSLEEKWINTGVVYGHAAYPTRVYENVVPTLQTSWGTWSGDVHLNEVKIKYKYRATAVLNLDDWFNQNADKCIIEAYPSYYDQFYIGCIAPIIELTGQKVSGQPSVYLFSSDEEPDADVDYPPVYKWIRVTKVR